MGCEETRNLLDAYLDGETTQSEKESMEAHLAACPACREELKKLDETQAKFKQTLKMAAQDADPSPEAWNRLRRRILDENQKAAARVLPQEPFWQRMMGKHLTWKTATAGMLAVALIVSAAIALPMLTGHSGKLSAAEIALADPAVQAALGGVEPEGISVTENIGSAGTTRVVMSTSPARAVIADIDMETSVVIDVRVQEYSEETQQQALAIALADSRVQSYLKDGYTLHFYDIGDLNFTAIASFTPEEKQLLASWGVNIEDLIGLWATMALKQNEGDIDAILVWVNVSTERVVAFIEHPFAALATITTTSTSTPVTITGVQNPDALTTYTVIVTQPLTR